MTKDTIRRIVNSNYASIEPDIFEFCQKNSKAVITVEAGIDEEFKGTWSMLKLWRKWMDETAQFMRNNGVKMPHYIDKDGNSHGTRMFNADDAHELFTIRWMGTDRNGRRYSWSLKAGNQDRTPAPKAKRLYAMDKHFFWSLEKGIKLTNPEDSEFRNLQMEQEK